MKLKTIEERLTHNVAFWEEAEELAKLGYVPEPLRIQSVGEEPAFHVVLTNKETKDERIVVNDRQSPAAPALIRSNDILLLAAAHTNLNELSFPLGGSDQHIHRMKRAWIRFNAPNPAILWKVEVDGDLLQGNRKPLTWLSLADALQTAYSVGPGRAFLEITPPLREHFRARRKRIELVERALSKAGKKLAPWSDEQGFKYSMLYKVLTRGDNNPEMRAKLAELAGAPVNELFPDIDWGKVDQSNN